MNTATFYDNDELVQKMRAFYKEYYHDDLRLPNWERRFETFRINEEDHIGKKVIDFLRKEDIALEDKKILVVGGGTGAEVFYLFKHFTKDVHTIEPSQPALDILNIKAEMAGLPLANIQEGVAEALPYADGTFDVVICFTVLEHVQDVEKSILEMHRVAAPGGVVMIETPNYLFLEEPHYKVGAFPPRLSKRLARLNLKLYGKYTPFFESLNFFSAGDIDAFLKRHDFQYVRRDKKYITCHSFKSFVRHFLVYLYSWITGISRNQLIYLYKK